MKKNILLFILIVLTLPATACEICGCGNNNFQIGVLPSFRKGFVGLRYSYSSFRSTMRDDQSEFSHDRYQSMELWGGYQLRRLQVMTFVPYYKMDKVNDDGRSTSSGIGDALLLLNYRILSTARASSDLKGSIKNELFLGGGIKFATGINRIDVSDPEFNTGFFNSQPGTGSTDILATLTHNLLWNSSGAVTNLAYRVNGKNDQDFRFGNCFYGSTSFFRTFRINSVKFNPIAGINIMINRANTFGGAQLIDSKGHIFSSMVGLNVVLGKFGLLANTFVPVMQNMYDGQTELKTRSTVGLTLSF